MKRVLLQGVSCEIVPPKPALNLIKPHKLLLYSALLDNVFLAKCYTTCYHGLAILH
jgi:hypothetical protein